MKKNVASQVIGAQLVSATDGSAFTGAVTCIVTIDGGTQGGGGACTHEGNGFHSYAPSQAETNGNHVAFTFTGTGAVPVTIQVYTTFPQTLDVGIQVPTALTYVGGKADVNVATISNNVITAASINADAITNAKIADDAIAVENIKDSAITAAKIATGAIDADAIADDAIDAGAVKADAVTKIQNGLATTVNVSAVETDTQDIQSRLPAALTANGNMKSSLVEILTTALTETAGYLAAGFKKFFNVSAAPVSTMDVIATVTNLTNAPTDMALDSTVAKEVTLTTRFEDGAVWVDYENGTSGTGSTVGTAQNPSNNIADAVTIADANKLNIIKLKSFSEPSVQASLLSNKTIIGIGNVSTFRIVLTTDIANQARFENVLIHPNSNAVYYTNCHFKNCLFEGSAGSLMLGTGNILEACAFDKELSISFPSSHCTLKFFQTHMYIPSFNMSGNFTRHLTFLGCSGSIAFSNMDYASHTIFMAGFIGNLELASTCTAGTFNNKGIVGTLLNNSSIVVDLISKVDLDLILNKAGAITGSGDNTILGMFKALLNKSAAIPSDIGGTFDPAADSTEAISEAIAAGVPISGDVTLATSQPNYAPSKAGDAMALTSGERTTLTASIWDALTSGLTTVGSIGKYLLDKLGLLTTTKNIYVDDVAGNDSYDGLSFATAKKTMAGATALFSSGDRGTIFLGAGSYSKNIIIPSNVKLTSYGNGIAYINGEYVSLGTPVVDMLTGSSIVDVRVIKAFNGDITQIIKAASLCIIDRVSGYILGTGAIDSFANISGSPKYIDVRNCFYDGGGIIKYSVTGGGASVVSIESNHFSKFTDDNIYLPTGGFTRIFRNRFLEVATDKYAIHVREANGFSTTENNYSGAGSMYLEDGTPGVVDNIEENNGIWGAGDAPTVVQIRQEMDTNSTKLAIVPAIKAVTTEGRPGATIKFVDKQGADTNDGVSWGTGNAYLTLAKAVSMMDSVQGGFIYVGPGYWDEDVTVPDNVSLIGKAGDEGDRLTEIRGLPTGSTSATLSLGYNAKAICIRIGKQSGTSIPIRMKSNSSFLKGSTGGFDAAPTAIITHWGEIAYDGALGVTIEENWLSGSGGIANGVTGNFNNSVIQNNTFLELSGDHIKNPGSLIDIEDNTFLAVATGKYAVSIAGNKCNVVNNQWDGAGSFMNDSGTGNIDQNNGPWAGPTDLTLIAKEATVVAGFSAGAKDSTVAKDATVAKDSTVAKEATVVAGFAAGSKPGTAQTITPPADMALNSTVAKEATVSAGFTAGAKTVDLTKLITQGFGRLEFDMVNSKAYIWEIGGGARKYQATLSDSNGDPVSANTVGPINMTEWTTI